MIALSQYQCYCKFESLQDKEHVLKLRDAILKFHDEISSSIPFPDYVIDIVVFKDFSCQVIEFNPMGAAMSSGAALYNWLHDSDLLTGKLHLQPPPIRILRNLNDEDNAKIN
jgi:hypothetical protein